jgi:transposase
MVKDDTNVPKRLRTSAMRIFKTLRDDHQYTGCYNVVQEYVRQARNPSLGLEVTARRHSKAKSETENLAPGSHTEPPSAENSITAAGTQVFENAAVISRTSSIVFRQSRRPQRERHPEEQSFAWMRDVQQGRIPLDILGYELSDVPLQSLEILHAAVTKGKLSTRNRALAVMSYVRGIDCEQICSFLQISTATLYRYWRTYRDDGTQALLTRKERSDKRSNDEDVKKAVFALLHSPPSAHGVNRTSWTIRELQKVLAKGEHPAGSDSIRTIIKESGFQWRHARIVLTSNDPDYSSKVAAITKILSELKSDEAFFSVDEYGPFAIKTKGGKKRVAPGEQYTVPQWQKSKGWMILTAALELSRNQVTHFYSHKKNTAEMIRMADVLREQYRGFRTLYLSWDAASWHVSKELLTHLDKINERAAAEGFPVIRTAPLPSGAQFLNVIESVFSGMAKAIIHNSDYPSVEMAREAIDRYFRDRNQQFSEHPERAGKKIWGKERVPSAFAEGQNCKDPMYQYLI